MIRLCILFIYKNASFCVICFTLTGLFDSKMILITNICYLFQRQVWNLARWGPVPGPHAVVHHVRQRAAVHARGLHRQDPRVLGLHLDVSAGAGADPRSNIPTIP